MAERVIEWIARTQVDEGWAYSVPVVMHDDEPMPIIDHPSKVRGDGRHSGEYRLWCDQYDCAEPLETDICRGLLAANPPTEPVVDHFAEARRG